MGTMTALEEAGRFTRADFEALPDDARRYEQLDGAIVVTPSPGPGHQRVVTPYAVTVCPSTLVARRRPRG